MKKRTQLALITLLALFLAVLAGILLTRPVPEAPSPVRMASASVAFDQHQLDVAQGFASTADTEHEQAVAQVAVGLADQEMDLAFAGALREAAGRSTQAGEAPEDLTQRVTDSENSVAADKAAVDQLSSMLARASGARKAQLESELELARSLQTLSEEQLANAKDDVARAGGDPTAQIRRLMAEHEAQGHAATSDASKAGGQSGQSVQLQREAAHNTLALFRAWYWLLGREGELRQAQQNALAPLATLSRDHNVLEHRVTGGDAEAPPAESAPAPENNPPAASVDSSAQTAAQEALLAVRQRTEDQRAMSDLDKRMGIQQRLSKAYGRWADLVVLRRRATLHKLLWSILFLLVIALCVVAAEMALNRFFANLDPQRRGLHTLRGVARYLVRGAGLVLLFLAFFGPPSQLATVIALAGAGLTIVLKDFVVGFFGWFMLQGRDGIRVGDWVEINGVSGEVIEVGLFHTLLLETGDWSDGAAPTGRKVKFVNSFAIEGHYFNFTTSGRWLWDELQIVIPRGTDPFPIADEIQKLATRETEGSMRQAEEDWRRTSGRMQRVFPTAPNVRVRPDPQGAIISVRYLTQAKERFALSARIYREMMDLLRDKDISQSAVTAPSESPVSS